MKNLLMVVILAIGQPVLAKPCDKMIPEITKNMVNGGYLKLMTYSQQSEIIGRAEFFMDRGPRASMKLIVVALDQTIDPESVLPSTAEKVDLVCVLRNGNKADVYKILTLVLGDQY